jgi:hypothetical protein
VSPAFAPGLRLDRDVLEQWADFDARIGIVDRRPDVQRAFDFTLLGGWRHRRPIRSAGYYGFPLARSPYGRRASA